MFSKWKNIFKDGSSYKVFLLSILVASLGYGIYKGVIDNYFAEIVTMTEMDHGLTEFFREIPGLLLVFILALLYRYSAEQIFKIGAVVMLIGLGIETLFTISAALGLCNSIYAATIKTPKKPKA